MIVILMLQIIHFLKSLCRIFSMANDNCCKFKENQIIFLNSYTVSAMVTRLRRRGSTEKNAAAASPLCRKRNLFSPLYRFFTLSLQRTCSLHDLHFKVYTWIEFISLIFSVSTIFTKVKHVVSHFSPLHESSLKCVCFNNSHYGSERRSVSVLK